MPQIVKLEKPYTHPVHFESGSNKIEVLLGMLDAKKEIKTEDGYEGTVYLDTDSIKAEAKGYGSKTVKVNKVRIYYNLSNRDLSYVPKSITENGVTYQFRDIHWQAANLEQVDGYLLPDAYTAVATYEGSKTERYATGYTVEARYQGTLEKTEEQGTVYRLLFTGKKQGLSESAAARISGGVILAMGCMGAGIYGAKRFRKYKEAREKGIVFVVKVNDLSELRIKDEDIVLILSNLLNNAIEASAESKEPVVKLKFIRECNQIIISVVNTLSKEPCIIGNKFITTKEDTENHGIGIENIRETVEKYGGSCVIKYDESSFRFVILIPDR